LELNDDLARTNMSVELNPQHDLDNVAPRGQFQQWELSCFVAPFIMREYILKFNLTDHIFIAVLGSTVKKSNKTRHDKTSCSY
jgi:hypothetical protein